MATTLTPEDEITFSFPIEKSEDTDTVGVDGTPDLIVYGKATDGTVDGDLQIVDPDWSGKALQEWLATGGNLRVQHQAKRDPAGRGLEVDVTPDGHYVKALVVEPVAKHLVRTGTLRDYSVGVSYPDIVPDPTGKAIGGIIRGRTDGRTRLSELSLVDRGSNFNSKFQIIKSVGDAGDAEFVGKVFNGEGEEVTYTMENAPVAEKAAIYPTHSVSLPDDVSVSFKPSDLVKLLAHRDEAQKRNMDPNVGGGVDRDKVPDTDFAGRDRSFPIVTPGDVSDAASSIGRAGSSNYSSDQLKQNIIRIARRKGPSFEAQLPDAWKDGDAKKGDAVTDETTPPVIEETVKADETVEPAIEVVEPEETKASPPPPDGDTGTGDGSDGEDDDDDEDGSDDDTATKGSKTMCKGCGGNLKASRKFCPNCGTKNPVSATSSKAEDTSTTVAAPPTAEEVRAALGVEKKQKSKKVRKSETPTDGVTDTPAAKPVPGHREPDGTVVATLERDAGMASDTSGDDSHDSPRYAAPKSDSSAEIDTRLRLKSLGVPDDLGKLHDLTCPCYHPDDVAKCYPHDTLSGLDVNYWQQKAFQDAATASLEKARQATLLWQHVVTLKNCDPDVLDDLRSESYKAFTDANPGPGTYPTPTQLSPQRFQRPYLSGGHAAPSPGHGGPNTASVPSGQVTAGDFQRDYLSAGHAAESPTNKGTGMPVSAPVTVGVPSRVYYTTAMRNNARQAMSAMHDHIAQTFPDVCPSFTGSPYDTSLPPSRPVPVGVGSPVPHAAPAAVKTEKSLKKRRRELVDEVLAGKVTLEDARKELGLVNEDAVEKAAVPAVVEKAAVLDEAAVEAIVTRAVAARDEEIADLRKNLKRATKALEKIAEQAEPGGPYRGLALDQTVTKTSAAPVALPQLGIAERAQKNLYDALYEQWRNNPDPTQREVAWAELTKMTGIRNAILK